MKARTVPARDKAPSFWPSHPTEQYKKHPIKVATCFDSAENVSQLGLRRRQHHGRLIEYSASAPSLTFTINTQQTTLYPLQIKPKQPRRFIRHEMSHLLSGMSKWALPPTAGLFKSVSIWVKVLSLSEEQSTESQIEKNVLWEWLQNTEYTLYKNSLHMTEYHFKGLNVIHHYPLIMAKESSLEK